MKVKQLLIAALISACGAARIVNAQPSITQDTWPASGSDVAGSQVTFSAAFSGAVSYQWLSNGVPLSGAVNTTLTLPNLQTVDTAAYSLEASDGMLTSTSDACAFLVVPTPTVDTYGDLVLTSYQNATFTTGPSNGVSGGGFTPTWTIASGDLLYGTEPSSYGAGTGSENGFINQGGAGGEFVLTDGTFPGVGGYAGISSFATLGRSGGAATYVTYTLPASTYGYNITNIQVYGGWVDNGRDQQDYTVRYATVSAPGTFIELDQIAYQPSASNSPTATHVTFINATNGVMATNVYAVEFDFTTPTGTQDWVGYAQLQVFGTPALTGPIQSAASFSGLTSRTVPYGTSSLTLSGKVSGTGPTYPASGETVTVSINGNQQNTTINDSTGDFSINYNPSTIPSAPSSPYTITYGYGGDSALFAANDTSTTLTITNATPTVTVTVGSYTYSGSPQGPSAYTTSPAGDTGATTWSYVGTGGTSYGPSATQPTAVGTYTAQVSLGADSNNNAASSIATAFTITSVNIGNDTWQGNSDANWATAGNWNPAANAPPSLGDSLIFGAAGSSGALLNNNIAAGLTIGNANSNAITFNPGASAYTFSGNSISLSGGISNSSTANQTINLNSTFNNGNSYNFTTTAGGGNITYGGIMSDSDTAYAFIIGGGGAMYITNLNNTYSDQLWISNSTTLNVAGLNVYGANGPLGNRTFATDSSAGNAGIMGLVLSGGKLQYTGTTPQLTDRMLRLGTNAYIDASGTGLGTVCFSAPASTNLFGYTGSRTLTLIGSNTGTNTFASILQDGPSILGGPTSLLKAGSGTWIYSGNNNYLTNSGFINVSNGTLILTGENSLRSGGTTNEATLQLQANAGNTFSVGNPYGVVCTVLGTNLNAGCGLGLSNNAVLQLRADANTLFYPDYSKRGMSLLSNNSVSNTVDVNQLTGAGSGDTLTLGSSLPIQLNPTTGGGVAWILNVTGGNGDSLNIPAGVNIGANGGAIFNPTTANLIMGPILNSPSAGITKSGAGTMTVVSNSTPRGAYTVNGGTLILTNVDGGSNGRWSGGASITNATLVLRGTSQGGVGGNNAGSATGTITVYGGVSPGTLQLQADSGNTNAAGLCQALSVSNSMALNGGATLQLRADANVTFAGGDNMQGLGVSTITIDVNQLSSGSGNIFSLATNGFNTYATTINVTGGNGDVLKLGSLTNTTGTSSLTLVPTTANVSVGAVTATAGTILVLDGTSSANYVTGSINNGTGIPVGVTKQNTSVWTLMGNNNYTSNTIISAGTLALGTGGSINNSATNIIGAGGTFDVSALSSPYTLSSSTSLSASGTGTTVGTSAAAIKGASAGTVNLGSQPITLSYDGSDPALYISQGTLSLNGNAFTVNTTNGSPLAAASYTIIRQASGTVSSSGSYTVTGSAIGAGTMGSITVSGANVNLVIQSNSSPAAPAAISVTGGTTQLSFTGVPGSDYAVQRSTNLVTGTGWVTIWTTNAPAGGLFNYIDTFSGLGATPATAYYKLISQP